MIIPAGMAQVNLVFVGDNLPTGAQVTFGVENGTNLSADDVGDAVATAVQSGGLQSLMVNDQSIVSIHVKLGPNATGPFADVAVSIPGGSAATGVSPNVALLIKKSTALGGKKGSGRMYWPGLPEGVIGSDGTLDAGFMSTAQTICTDFLTDLATNNVNMFLLHNDSTNVTEVTSLQCQAVGATQRRRLRR